jgi:tripartite-type tricarboxylate transporter receptor subunit TctC
MIVPLVPGGNQDIVARAVAEEMSKDLGQQVIVENRPGQSAIIGTQFVKNAPPTATRCSRSRSPLRVCPE